MNDNRLLKIIKKSDCLHFGMRSWEDADYKKPLTFKLQNGIISKIYMCRPYSDSPEGVTVPYNMIFELYFENPLPSYLSALTSRGQKSFEFAKYIHKLYAETYYKFESVLRTGGKVKNLLVAGPESIYSFFSDSRWNPVEYQINNEPKNLFLPKLPKPRRKFALYKSQQLVSPEKWKKIQDEIDQGYFPSEEILELHRIWGKLDYKEKRLPIVEAAIIIETILKEYSKKILEKKGFSKNKIKDLRNDLTFNISLNLVLPLTLTKTEIKRINSYVLKINKLRKLRNDIVHEDISDENIDRKEAKLGVESGINLIEFIHKKIHNF